jgi:phospholipid/cholesterol/gamma-HCH transport system permease protein
MASIDGEYDAVKVALVRVVIGAGERALGAVADARSMTVLFLQAVHGCFRPSRALSASFVAQISRQILYTGVEAMGLVGIIAFFCGVTIVLQSMKTMPQFGVTEYFGNLLVVAVVREIGPFFTSLVVIGRSGAALAAHIGTMRVNKEIDALEVMGIDPVHFVVVPAFLGMTFSMVCLNCYFDMIAIVGGLVIANVTVQIPFGIFIVKVLDALSWTDVVLSSFKSMVFGSVIAVMSCWYGLTVGNIRAVPQAAMRAVVGSMTVTIIFNILVTVGFYAR